MTRKSIKFTSFFAILGTFTQNGKLSQTYRRRLHTFLKYVAYADDVTFILSNDDVTFILSNIQAINRMLQGF